MRAAGHFACNERLKPVTDAKSTFSCFPHHKTAILIDGGFFRKKAKTLWGVATAEERANDVFNYSMQFIKCKVDGLSPRSLYRIFYYDCPPTDEMIFHPLTQSNIDFSKQDTFQWTNDFYNELKKKRKVALRMGKLSKGNSKFEISFKALNRLCSGKISVEELTEDDFRPSFKQKGVDMRIGIDITSLAYEQIVDQIILIAGDSDFVPAAKLARRKGIDFILDPFNQQIQSDLFEHIDGLESHWKEFAKTRS